MTTPTQDAIRKLAAGELPPDTQDRQPKPLNWLDSSAYERGVIERLDLILAELREQTRLQRMVSDCGVMIRA